MPAMNKRDYDIGTSVTDGQGKESLDIPTAVQRNRVTGILELQREPFQESIDVRRSITVELRKYLAGGPADHDRVLAPGRRHGGTK
jgi:hypothetical protein